MLKEINLNGRNVIMPLINDNWTDLFIEDCKTRSIDYCVFDTSYGRIAMTIKTYMKLSTNKLKKLGILGGN